ncbi:hypothetical protein JOQ06_029750 [Pogonophryne albipinna]|uniref:Lysophosphatidic acid phosphatase type 6 n=1 Tax=Pogonophryne albipinna TaxID=1090488 RepID=A0AAD6AXQ3_9TELE|nr:hypothetical protein JOQ06_029750 [Pogonophryne albipinna]
MRNLWTKAGVFGSVSMAFGSMLWSQKNPDSDQASSPSGETDPSSSYELKLVQVLFRHGARTPLKSIPDVMEAQWVPTLLEPPAHTQINYEVTDLNGGPRPPAPVEDSYRKNILSGGSFSGQLTTVGMQQLYELGKRLRTRYLRSMYALLILAVPAKRKRNCAYIHNGLLKILASHRWAESSTLPDIAADLQSIQSALGIAAHQHIDFILIRDDMVARETHGLPCPSVLDTWRTKVEQRAVDMICHVYEPSKRENLQLCVGPLMHTMLANIEGKLQGTSSEPKRKLFLYSAHDTTLIPCLMALGIFDMKWPPYAADITVELHQHRQTNKPFVKVSYIDQDQLIPGCSGVYCPLDEFKQVLSSYSLSSDLYQSLCNSKEDSTKP